MQRHEDDLSDNSDEFEYSGDGSKPLGKGGNNKNSIVQNKQYDEAYEISQDLSVADSFDARDKSSKEKVLRNDKFDEAIDVSQSMDPSPQKSNYRSQDEFKRNQNTAPVTKGGGNSGNNNNSNKASAGSSFNSKAVAQAPYDEEFLNSDDESVDSNAGRGRNPSKQDSKQESNSAPNSSGNAIKASIQSNSSAASSSNNNTQQQIQQNQQSQPKTQQTKPAAQPNKSIDTEASSDEGDGNEESYEQIEGAYHAKDYQHLPVSEDIKDLFNYIERFKPQEIELETKLKCFIPEYIPSIGEMDAFVKVPRPDGANDELGLKLLDEPSASQSDPTVLELQLRATSKKLQYGDVVVRSIENAAKNPLAIEKWIQNVSDLHRSKPPVQVHYRKNMPDIDFLMDQWPEQFEAILTNAQLPTPDLDVSLLEYVKILCNILDIPVYDNPVESLHCMFSLFMDFRNNPHFQQRAAADAKPSGYDVNEGANVMTVDFKA
jgi:intraflagellar transport protein 46